MTKKTVLIADDDAAIRTVLNQAFFRAGFETRVTSSITTLWQWIESGQGDVVVSDVIMPDGDAFDLLPQIKKKRPNLQIVVISAQNTFMTAVKAQESGAYEYLPKPFDISELITVVSRALDEPDDNRGTQAPDEYNKRMPLVGRSPQMQEIYRSLARLIQTEFPIMLSGEIGTGKELVARVLHEFGKRSRNNFVSINLAAVPSETIESHLFGLVDEHSYETRGKITEADGGTIYLDEVATLPQSAQARLLEVLQDGEFTPVGSKTPRKIDVRVIGSGGQELDEKISQGLFQEELFYRLNVVPMKMPALRERLEDVPDLARHFLKLSEIEGGSAKHLTADALKLLKEHSWPGNIHELENLIKRICILYPQDTIDRNIIEAELKHSSKLNDSVDTGVTMNFEGLRSATEYFVNRYFAGFENELPEDGVYQRFLEEFEYPVISAALAATNGNQIKAAQVLGLNRNTLRKKIKTHGIRIIRTAR